ncbi:uncharacterized protein LOC135694887 isoform X2 [Rhopilema esculentum]|uniref:uncharacterized protein LOC135694887 isoform X2 n=1 Tax=Rhopilema esculentum TaxID=499914 RepID=UPI0031E28E3A
MKQRFCSITSVVILLLLSQKIVKVHGSHCDDAFYNPVADCQLHPIRVGYFASPQCGSLHTLTDSDGRPNADFARLNHPSSYSTESGTKYHEYAAGHYLTIKLEKRARIYGIAVQGSPDSLRYYLKSMELWYKVTINDLDVKKPATTFETFYKEANKTKRFIGDMRTTTKFTFANPFYADEIRIYPITFYGDKVFRTELYGCFLGRVTVPASVGIGNTTVVSMSESQNSVGTKLSYYFKMTHPDGTKDLVMANGTLSYIFSSRGKATIELGVNYSTGWISTDKVDFIVQGPINGLKLKLDSSEVSPLVKTESSVIEFHLETADQPYQIKRYHFSFGDGATCDFNYCKHSFSRGLYKPKGVASNDFYQSSLERTLIICPASNPGVSYTPTIYGGGIGIEYLGPDAIHNLTVRYYALHTTTSIVSVNSSETNRRTFTASGWVDETISLPKGLTAPSQHVLQFTYTDWCGSSSISPVDIFLDEKIAGVSLRVNQTFKSELIEPVSYYFINKPIDFYLDIQNGTSLQCHVTIPSYGFVKMNTIKADREFKGSYTYSAVGDITSTVTGRCSSRLNVAYVYTTPTVLQLKLIPEAMTNFSLELSNNLVQTGQSFQIRLIFLQGNKMSCNISASTAAIFNTFTYTQLLGYQQAHTLGRKAYVIGLATNLFSFSHRIDVVCRNILGQVQSSVNFQAQLRMAGISMNLPSFLCYNSTLLVPTTLTQGRPVYKTLSVDTQVKENFQSDNITANVFSIYPYMYGESGWKTVLVRAWNNVSSMQTSGSIRIARNVTVLAVLTNFTMSSPQALPARHADYLPMLERINFTAIVSPNANGFIYHWSINGSVSVSEQTTGPYWFFTFPSTGSFLFKLVVDGCNDYVYQKTFEVLEPVKDFSLAITPFPVVVVNKTVSLNFTPPANCECVQVDFDNGSPLAEQCRMGRSHSAGCNPMFTDCRTTTIYRNRGNLTVKVTASNKLYVLQKSLSIVAKTCYNPVVIVQGNGTNLNTYTGGPLSTLYRSEKFVYAVTSVGVNCEVNAIYNISWKVFSPPLSANKSSVMVDPKFLLPNSLFEFGKNYHTMSIPCCTLNYGSFLVEINVQMTGGLLTTDFKEKITFGSFLNDTDLVASLDGSKHRIYAYNEMILLNASNSFDPDGYSKNLSFTWYCKDTELESRDLFSIKNITTIDTSFFISPTMNNNSTVIGLSGNTANMSTSNVTNEKTDQSIIGCFGKPFGRLDVSNTTKTISVNSTFLQENHTIMFYVVVEGASETRSRRAEANQTVFVRMRETPYFEIRCAENCGRKIDPSGKFTLKAVCKSEACERRASYRWSLMHSGGLVSLDSKLYSNSVSKDLLMKPNVLSFGVMYTIKMKATALDGATYEQVYIVNVNEPPKNGSCTMSPNEGFAINTLFLVNCTGWTDPDVPLTYEVAHQTDYLSTVLCKHEDSSCETFLPMEGQTNKVLQIRIRIIDSFEAFTEINHAILVKKPTLTVEKLDNLLVLIQNSSSSQKAAQLIGAVASVLNQPSENIDKDLLKKSIQMRDGSISTLAKMLNASSDEVIAPQIALLAQEPSQFTLESANIATDLINVMTDRLLQTQSTILFRDIVYRGQNILAAMGTVTRSASVNLDPNRIAKNDSNSTEEDLLLWKMPQGRAIVLRCQSGFEKMTNLFFSRLSPYDAPIRIVTSSLAVLLEKKLGTELNVTRTLSIAGSKVSVPSLESLNLNSSLVINSQLKVTTFNEYFWSNRSRLINTTVTQFDLKSGETPLAVRNTQKPVELELKRELSHPIQYQHWRFQERPGQERVNFHKLEIKNDNSLHIELKPMNYCVDYHVFLNYGSRPSRDHYLKNWTLPDLSTCNRTGLAEDLRANICSIYQSMIDPALRIQVNGSQLHLNCTLRKNLELRVNDALKNCTLDPYRVFLSDVETKNGIFYFGVYEADRVTSDSQSPAFLYNSSSSCQVADNISESSYFLRSYTSKCRFWDPAKAEEWLSEGCQIEQLTSPSVVHCKCNHLTSFAGDFFIAPNPIDIDKVIEGFKNIQDNVSVVVLISVLCGIYILLVVVLRKHDKKDVEKLSVVVLDNDSTKPYEYLIITVTGARVNAGTTAHVFCSLNSSEQVGEPRVLFDPEKTSFQRDQINAFKVAFDAPIKDLTDIRLWHDNAGDSPGWYLSRVYVEDLRTNKTYLFICERWLAVELEDGVIDRVFSIANSDDQKTFSHIFTTKAAADLSDQHLWLSVALKRAHDSFTRVQRVTCCMALLFTTMLASAMFFQLNKESKYLWKIGSLVIDYKGIVIGIQSGFVVIPINFAIAWIFRHSESFANYKRRRSLQNQGGTPAKRKLMLPCGFVIVGWFLAITAIVSSLVVVLFYSMQWGNEKSQQFVLSIFTSFIQSAFLIQPLKLIFVAFILALIFKKTSNETHILEMYKYLAEEKEASVTPVEIDLSKIQMSPLTEDQLKYARKRRAMEIRLKIFVQDILSYLVFLTFLCLVVRGYRDPDEYLFRKALNDDIVHSHYEHLKDVPGVWTWVQQHFIPAIYTQEWYNGDNFTNFKMLQNQEAYRIGLARIRQLRVKPGACKLVQDVTQYFNSCNSYYSLSDNEERNYDIGWKDINLKRSRRSSMTEGFEEPEIITFELDGISAPNISINTDYKPSMDMPSRNGEDFEVHSRQRRALKFKVNRKTIPSSSKIVHSNEVIIDSQYLLPDGTVRPNKDHWRYRDMSSLRGFPYYGHFSTYSGGGYVASLATDIDYARATAMALEQDTWIDTLTRAVFFEFSVYNANMNFFATGFVIAEVLPTGTVYPSASIRVFKLYRYVGVFGKLVMASEIILVLCLLFFIYKECRSMVRVGCAYFKSFWSWIEITIAIALFAAIFLRAFSWYEADKNLSLLREQSERFISFHYTVIADEALLISVTIISFASTLKIMKIISVFPTIVVLKETVLRFSRPLLNYTMPFVIAFYGFAAVAFLLFHQEYLFSTYIKAAETQMLMLVGGSVYHSLLKADPILGPLFFLLFAAAETFIMLNVLLVIINDSIKESSDWKAEARSNDFVDFIEERVRAIFNISPAKRKRDSQLRKSFAGRKVSRKVTILVTDPDDPSHVKTMPVTVSKKVSIRKPTPRSTSKGSHSRRFTRLETLLTEELTQRRLLFAIDNCHWSLDKLESWIQRSRTEEKEDTKLELKLMTEVLLKKA